MGRLQHALDSLRLLCTPNLEQAKNLADRLGTTNKERQNLTLETLNQARLLLAGTEGELPRFLVVDSDQYQEGVIGLVAGKLVEEYYRPTLVIARGEIYSKASGRSIGGFNIIEAIRRQSDLIIEAGGHPMAAGLTIKTGQIEVFKQRLQKQALESVTKEMMQKTQKVDLVLPSDLISLNHWEKINKLSPFGIGNPQPVFSGQARIKNFRTVGNQNSHLKLELLLGQNKDGLVFSAIGFGMGSLAGQLKIDQQVQIAYNLSLNEWNQRKNIELKLKDLI
jgi:single-stranded-DNA-specific exonuclease